VWQQIRANKRSSIFLISLMAGMLVLLGYFLGLVFAGYRGALFGIVIAIGLWVILTILSFSSGDQILLSASKARRVTKKVHPQLFNVVEEMSIAANLPMPKVYIINDPAPNAFATGRKPENASIAVTAGLLGKLNRDELQGVVAHEMSHILHRDILFVTIAGIMLGTIVLLSQVFLRGMFYRSLAGGNRRFSSGGKGGGQAQLVMLVIAILAAILAPLFAQLLYFSLSRKREYLADAGSARLTRYPPGLASALEKIASDKGAQLGSANKVTAPMYICNPLKKKKKGIGLSDLTSTHPPISERVKVLRSMGGASFKDYSESFSKVAKKRAPIPGSALKDEHISLRSATQEKSESPQKQARQVADIMRIVNGFMFLTCTCGLKLKIPANYKSKQIRCPKCKKTLQLPKKGKNN
jgi:heat shock protein HtpX